MSGLAVLIATLLNAAVIGLIARRLVAVPVGWPRTIALAVILNAVAAPVSASVGAAVGAEGPIGPRSIRPSSPSSSWCSRGSSLLRSSCW